MSYDANSAYNANNAYPSGPGAPGPGAMGPGAMGPDGQIRGASSPEDLSLPLYGASFGQAVKRFFQKYVTFSGRASRSEFWWVMLLLFLIQLIPSILYMIGLSMATVSSMAAAGSYSSQMSAQPSGGALALIAIGGLLMLLIGLATIIPQLAIIWRRLHDANLAGPFFFLSLIPGVGSLILFVLELLPPKPEGQRFDV